MNRDTLMIIGNGFTRNLLDESNLDKSNIDKSNIDSSKPLSNFNCKAIDLDSSCLNKMLILKDIIDTEKKIYSDNDFECFENIINKYSKGPISSPNRILCLLRRYLSFAYSKLFVQIKHNEEIDFNDWKWYGWFQRNINRIGGVYNLNYDLFLEDMFKSLNIEYHRVATTEHIKVLKHKINNSIPIFKPHGSIDFDFKYEGDIGWETCITDANGLYDSDIEGYDKFAYTEIVNENELCKPRFEIDIIPPNSENFYIELPWIKNIYNELEIKMQDIINIICFGFSYSSYDRPEFNRLLDYCKSKNITVYDLNIDLNSQLQDEVSNRGFKYVFKRVSDEKCYPFES